ncbi:MAG: SCO family protein [Bacteroidetes bacterium]|nr:SCO family protein [Bacteroidota bacterium]
MLHFFAKFKLLFAVLAVLSVFILWAIYSLMKPEVRLPVYQPAEVNVELVDSSIQHVKRYHKIDDFQLVNQNGDTITQADYDGRIYIADFFFTTCPSICPKMTANMLVLQHKLADQKDVLLLSHTVTPEIDSVAVLKAYATKHGVDENRWNLVTGSKKEIYRLARKSYLAAKTDGDGGPLDMIHTENFVLVDKERRIRGFYDGTKPEEVDKILADIKILRQEYP